MDRNLKVKLICDVLCEIDPLGISDSDNPYARNEYEPEARALESAIDSLESVDEASIVEQLRIVAERQFEVGGPEFDDSWISAAKRISKAITD